MGVPVRDFENFRALFQEVSEQGSLYAFFLYCNGHGHEDIANFVHNAKDYFNDLADSANTYLFFFDEDIALSPIENPSAVVASLFGISLAELPGLLIFSDCNEGEINQGVFFPLSRADMAGQPEIVQQNLAAVFAVLRDTQRSSQAITERMQRLKGEQLRLAAADRWRYIREGMGRALGGMRSLPTVFVESIARALGEAVAKRAGI